MATFTITKTTTVGDWKRAFRSALGGTLRIYDGRSEAPDFRRLVLLGAKTGTITYNRTHTVGQFETAVQAQLNLKVNIFTADNWVAVLNEIILDKVGKIPNSSTKAKMEVFLGDAPDPTPITYAALPEEPAPAPEPKLSFWQRLWRAIFG